MTSITPIIVLKALVKHETLTLPDLMLEKNLGVRVANEEVATAVEKLHQQDLVDMLDGVKPPTYTITEKGIEASQQLELQL